MESEQAEITLETNHGSFSLPTQEGDTIGTVLARAGIPMSAVWTYTVEDHAEVTGSAGARRVAFISSEMALDDARLEGRPVFARASRNINFPGLLGYDWGAIKRADQPSSEWIFPSAEGGAFRRVVCQLSASDCFDFVLRSTREVLGSWPESTSPRMIVGTSGGGDSNVLLSALLRSGMIEPDGVIPVMMLGIPDWDTQVENAKELCASFGIDLRIVPAHETAALAGVRSLPELRDRFRESYPDADLEFLGTWLLRKVLTSYARQCGVRYIAVGFNREDLVGEGLARIVRGKPPLPAPYRSIGDVSFVYPMWKVPKKIGDGAYVTYSMENYENREPSFSAGRSIYYYLAYWLADLTPGIDLDLLTGFAQLSDLDPHPLELDPELRDYVVADSFTTAQHERWKQLLASCSPNDV